MEDFTTLFVKGFHSMEFHHYTELFIIIWALYTLSILFKVLKGK